MEVRMRASGETGRIARGKQPPAEIRRERGVSLLDPSSSSRRSRVTPRGGGRGVPQKRERIEDGLARDRGHARVGCLQALVARYGVRIANDLYRSSVRSMRGRVRWSVDRDTGLRE